MRERPVVQFDGGQAESIGDYEHNFIPGRMMISLARQSSSTVSKAKLGAGTQGRSSQFFTVPAVPVSRARDVLELFLS